MDDGADRGIARGRQTQAVGLGGGESVQGSNAGVRAGKREVLGERDEFSRSASGFSVASW